MEKKPDDEPESDKVEKISCNEDSKQSNRVQLSPHSHNVSESAKKMVVADNTDKSSLKKESEPGSKENVAVDVETGDTGSADQEKEKKLPGSLVRAGTMRKRSYSFSDGPMKHPPLPPVKRWKSGRGGGGRGGGRGGVGVSGSGRLPSKFLLGGNINDPLNLNSLNDEKISRVVNAVTPESSPLPTPTHRKEDYKIEVLIPLNISDPLNLNAANEDDSDYEAKLISPQVKKKKIRHRKRLRKAMSAVDLSNLPGPKPELEEGHEGDISGTDEDEPTGSKTKSQGSSSVQEEDQQIKEDVADPAGKVEKTNSVSSEQKSVGVTVAPFKAKNEKFQYGNYNQYYGYRNPGNIEDMRLKFFKRNWFEEKEILDIGCNIGHITINIAKHNSPVRIVGMDIDKKLIEIARKNIRHYLDKRPDEKTKYPSLGSLKPSQTSQTSSTSPAPGPSHASARPKFPNNIQFVQGNYVLDCDELLENTVAEFDTIMLLSTTKWIHLNFGDDGLKRVFRRIYAQLRPGGTFILEAQSFSTYKKKKRLTETIFNNYKNIKMKPENFTDFLLHEVGFSRSEVVALPAHPSKGFQRPLQIFTKVFPSSNISSNTTPYSIDISPHCYNPSFTPFYGKITPGYTPRHSGQAAQLPTPLYSGPTPPQYYGPTPGGYSANSTPSHAPDMPGFTPRYTPSYTPAHPQSPGNTPNYSPGNITPGNTPTYSPGPVTPGDTPQYSPGAQYSPGYPGYSPSAVYSPGAGYSPSAPGYSPTPAGPSPSYSPTQPLYSPGNATPSYSPGEPAYSPSIQGQEVTGNTTPHPGFSGSPGSSPGPIYSWAGGVSGGNTPQHNEGGNTPQHGPGPGDNIDSVSSGEHGEEQEQENCDEEAEAEVSQSH